MFGRRFCAYGDIVHDNRLIQEFRVIELPEGEVIEPVGTERQRLTLVLSAADGCRVLIQDHK